MSKNVKLYRPPVPCTLRLTLVATLVAAGAFALYRRDPADRWITITAGVLALVLLFVSNLVQLRAARHGAVTA